jgi:hypothetical protein
VLRLLSIGPTTMSDAARRVSAGGAAQAAVMRASSEDRKAAGAGSGSPPPAGYRIQLKSADMKEEMRQEAFDIARVVRAASRLYSIRIISRALRPAALLVLTDGLVSVFFSPSGDFCSGCRRSRSTPWRRTSPSTSRRSSTGTTARPGTVSSAATLVMLSSHFLVTLLCTEAGG